ncbi:MAG TPA: oligosaccharide flippase family protein [Steroidobacteraceae bacterium]|nr:oligosaccharide flippase family protein [Steroidobacteraceae bacterium]
MPPTADRALDSDASVLRGMSWMTLNTIGARLVTFGAQILLGWILLPEDFGLYALALSVSNAVSAIRNGGSHLLLVRHGDRYDEFASPLTQYAFVLNFAAFGILLLAAPAFAHHFGSTDIGWLIVCIGLSIPVGTVANTYRCKLAIDGRFRELAMLSMASTVLWQLQTVVMALAGCGPYSYVVPMICQGLLEGVLGYWYVKQWPMTRQWIGWRRVVELLRETRWVMLGAAMLSLALSGHYFIVGLFHDAHVVGLFFFAYQIVQTATMVLNNSVEAVLPAILAKLNAQREQQSGAALGTLALLMIVSLPLSGALAVSAPSLIHWLWNGKWDESARAVSLLAFCIPCWMVIAVVRAVLEARGSWRNRFRLLAVYGFGGIGSAALGAWWGDLQSIAICVTAFYLVFSLALVAWIPRFLSLELDRLRRALLGPVVAFALCLIATFLGSHWLVEHGWASYRNLVEIATFAAASLAVNAIFFRDTWRNALGTVLGRPQRQPG